MYNAKDFKVGDIIRKKNGTPFGSGKLEERVAAIKPIASGANRVWTESGWVSDDIEVVSKSPVREITVIKKEFLPGNYGSVSVYVSDDKPLVSMRLTRTKKEVAEAIKTLQLIHDAME